MSFILGILSSRGLISLKQSTPKGENFGYRTFPVTLYNGFISEVGGDDGFAAAIAIIAIMITTVVFLLQKYIGSRKAFSMNSLHPIEAKKITGFQNIVVHAVAYTPVCIAILPQLYVFYTSFKNTKGMIFVEGYFFSRKPLLLSGGILIMVIALFIRRLPYTIRSSVAILQQIPMCIEGATISLGTPKMKAFFKVTVPMMRAGILSGAILSWVTMISELSTAIILYTGKTKTLTMAIYTEVIRGNYGIAASLATMLTLFTILSLLLFAKITKGKDTSI